MSKSKVVLITGASSGIGYATAKYLIEKGLVNTFDPSLASDADVVAKVINDAVESENPETRYPVGNMAKENIQARESMSDKDYDKMVIYQLISAAK